jgi:UMP-CMP kinase
MEDHNINLKPKVILVLGGPGSGKGTQCKLISEKYPEFIHLSIGDILREVRKTNNEINEMFTKYEQTGELFDHDLPALILKEYIFENKNKVCIIDGFHKTLEINECWNKHIAPYVDILLIIYFECSELTLKNRLNKRQRKDDNETVIEKRIETAIKETTKVLNYYNKIYSELIYKINSEYESDNVFNQICNIIIN